MPWPTIVTAALLAELEPVAEDRSPSGRGSTPQSGTSAIENQHRSSVPSRSRWVSGIDAASMICSACSTSAPPVVLTRTSGFWPVTAATCALALGLEVDPGAAAVLVGGPRPQRDAAPPREVDRVGVEDLGALRRELDHLVVADRRQELGGVDHPRVGRVDAVDVGADLAVVGAQRAGQRDRGGVGAAPAQRRDLRAGTTRPGSRRQSRPCRGRARPRSGTAGPRRCGRRSGGRWSGCRPATR